MKKDYWGTLKYQNLIALVDDGFCNKSLSMAFKKETKEIRDRFKRYFGINLNQYRIENNITDKF